MPDWDGNGEQNRMLAVAYSQFHTTQRNILSNIGNVLTIQSANEIINFEIFLFDISSFFSS